jgi:tetratricopeptide (TPR) repeat protein
MSFLLLALALAAPPAKPAPTAPVKPASASVVRGEAEPEVLAARLEARRCEEGALDLETSVQACREALRLGLREPRRRAVRQLLALRLAEAERYDELVEVYREDTRLHPEDPGAWKHLGLGLLYLREDLAAARTALEEARRLRPDDTETLVHLGVCLNALGEHAEAVAVFEQAQGLDADVFALRPAARAAFAASRRAQRWP